MTQSGHAQSTINGREFRLLDAGCGTGAYSEIVLPHVDHNDVIDHVSEATNGL